MTQLQLQNFADSMGLTCVGSTLVGAWNGYPFMATLRTGQLNVLNVSFSYLHGPAKKQLKQLRKALPRGCALSWTPNKLIMICSARDDQIAGLFRAGMDMISGELRACGAALSGTCPICKQGGCDGYAVTGGAYVPVHQHCCQNRSNDTVARATLNNLQGSYLTGWIGALIGGVVGLIPTVLLAFFGDMISAWLCALIPLGAYYGYKLLKGKMDRMATIATVVSSLLQVFILEQTIFYFSIVRYWGLWLSVFDSVGLYFEEMEVGDMVVDMIMPLIFIVLGIVIVSGIIKRTNQNDTMDASVMLGSLTDLNGTPVRQPESAYAAQQAQPQYQSYQQAPPAQPSYQTYQQTPPAQSPYQTYQQTPPAQPQYQTYQQTPPAQPVQPERPSQTAWGQAPTQWAQPAQPAQPVQPVQPVQPTQPTIQPTPEIPKVEPLNIQMPDLPDLPDTPKLDDSEQQ